MTRHGWIAQNRHYEQGGVKTWWRALLERSSSRPMMGPIADETLRLEDGRMLAWAEWGDPQGAPVFFLHCTPGSRLFCPDGEATTAAGLRLVTVDRPGYGGSDPSSRPSLLGFATDLGRLIDHLWLGRVSVVGWSGGGQYAAACAALLRERVNTLVLVSTPAPDEQVPWLTDSARLLAHLAKADPVGALPTGHEVARPLFEAPERVDDAWKSPSDAAIWSRPRVGPALVAMCREAFRTGTDGLAADVVAGSTAWRFDPGDVSARSQLFYGDDDNVVGLAHADWWAGALPDANLMVVRDAGHLALFVAWPEILKVAAP